ncbi:MAG TPA: hypothetical protein DIW47_00130 [Bacteroidetes bacterium]|nr:hypothetical protein [Bacteroidota bacterium]
MKKAFIILGLFIGGIAACTSTKTGETTLEVAPETATVRYQCPMKCQGDTAYTTAGKCPVCKMDLKEVKAE